MGGLQHLVSQRLAAVIGLPEVVLDIEGGGGERGRIGQLRHDQVVLVAKLRSPGFALTCHRCNYEGAVLNRWHNYLKETDRGCAAQRREMHGGAETIPTNCAEKPKPAARTAFRFDASVTRNLPAGVGAVALDFNGPRPATAADVIWRR